MATINQYKEFLNSNPEYNTAFEKFCNKTKQIVEAMQAKSVGQVVSIRNGKNKGFEGKVTFLGLTRIDRSFGSTENSVCIENNGVKVWTKVHNTEVKLAA